MPLSFLRHEFANVYYVFSGRIFSSKEAESRERDEGGTGGLSKTVANNSLSHFSTYYYDNHH